MARWLFKSEPEEYSFTNLTQDGETIWDGITNALALKHLRNAKVGDRILFYHTGKEKSVVGEMKIAEMVLDPLVVKVVPVKPWKKPVSLAQIKSDELLAQTPLVKLPRLSVVPLTVEEWSKIETLAR